MIITTSIFQIIYGTKTNAVNFLAFILIVPFNQYVVNNRLTELSYAQQLERYNKTITHEKIHTRQSFEFLFFGFTVWYIVEFIVRFIFAKNRSYGLVHRQVSFEKEAYENSSNPNYLKYRKFWSFLKYL
jgi:hypothetical protein